MKIKVDPEKCIGCGTCANLCPQCFELIHGISKPKQCENCSECDLNEVAESCPVEAITIEKE